MYVVYVFYGGALGFLVPYLCAFGVMSVRQARIIWYFYAEYGGGSAVILKDWTHWNTRFMYTSGVPGSYRMPKTMRSVYNIFFIIFIGPAWFNLVLIPLTLSGAGIGLGIDLWLWL